LKAPRFCPLLLLVVVSLREGKSLGNEEGKHSGSVRENTGKK
jgi:hypothetical protein